MSIDNYFYCINTFIETKQKHINYYNGLKYVITDPSLKFRNNNIPNKDVKLLLHFGGTDDRKLNLKIIDILPKIKNLKKVSIILGPALNYKHNLRSIKMEKQTQIHHD